MPRIELAQDDVLESVETWQQALLLEHEGNLAPHATQAPSPPAVEPTAADPQLAGIRPQLAVDEAEQGGLARATRPGHLDQLTGGDAEVDAFEDRAATEGLGYGDELDRRLSC